MSAYKKFTVAQLKDICEQRNIEYTTCKRKQELIDVLEQNDLRHDVITREIDGDDVENFDDNNHDNADVNDVENDDDEIEQTVSLGYLGQRSEQLRVVHDDRVAEQVLVESESVTALHLKLALVQAEREKFDTARYE